MFCLFNFRLLRSPLCRLKFGYDHKIQFICLINKRFNFSFIKDFQSICVVLFLWEVVIKINLLSNVRITFLLFLAVLEVQLITMKISRSWRKKLWCFCYYCLIFQQLNYCACICSVPLPVQELQQPLRGALKCVEVTEGCIVHQTLMPDGSWIDS